MRFIVLEGLDGSGKSTQINLLCNYFEDNLIKYKYLHFPRLDYGIYGDLIARFLRGEMGDISDVNAYLVALIFAGDRNEAKELINKWISEDHFVLVDRYVYSNIAFQCAKLHLKQEQEKLADWIINLEYNNNRLPMPDLNLFLDVPFDFTEKKLKSNRSGDDRTYLNGNDDIHEKDLDFQKRVSNVYHTICKNYGKLEIINCSDESGNMRSPEFIFNQILESLNLNNPAHE